MLVRHRMFVQDIKDRVERGELPPSEGQELINARIFEKPPKPPKPEEDKPLLGQAQAMKRADQLLGDPSIVESVVGGPMTRFDDPIILADLGITAEASLMSRFQRYRAEMKKAGFDDQPIREMWEQRLSQDPTAEKIWANVLRSAGGELFPGDEETAVASPARVARASGTLAALSKGAGAPVRKPTRPPAPSAAPAGAVPFARSA